MVTKAYSIKAVILVSYLLPEIEGDVLATNGLKDCPKVWIIITLAVNI